MDSNFFRKYIDLMLLLEDRAQYIAQSMKQSLEAAAQKDPAIKRSGGADLDSVKIVDQLKQMDADPAGKNLQFLARMYAANQFSLEDSAKIKNSIDMFLKHRNQLPVKDLNSLKSLDQLYDIIEPLEQQAQQTAPVSGKEQQRQIKSDAEKLIDSPNFKVIIPKTQEASCLYGKGTKWCTAGDDDNRFNEYNRQGPLYTIIANLGGKTRKFQLHYESDQFMNERDQPVTKADINALSQVPEYKKFLNYLIEKHYGKYFKKAAPA
jgi:hypothetical protein